MTFYERMAVQDKIERSVKLATTYLRKSSSMIYYGQNEKLPMSTWYWNLLDQALETSLDIVNALPDDYFEETDVGDFFGLSGGRINLSDDNMERIEKLAAAMKQRRESGKRQQRIKKLENVTGRTPEETASYLAAAKRLRAGA